MKKIYRHKIFNFILILLFIGAMIFLMYKRSANAPQPSPSERGDVSNPVSIKEEPIKEDNFTGKTIVISGSREIAIEAREYVKKTVDEFRAQANTDVPEMKKEFGPDSPTAKYTIEFEGKYEKNSKTESIIISEYVYTGGANGQSSYRVFTASNATGKILTLSDIVKEDKKASFTALVKKELNAWRPPESGGGPVVFEDVVKDLTFDSFLDWSLDDKNLTIYFDKYEVGPGALGAVTLPLSIQKIQGFLDPAFL